MPEKIKAGDPVLWKNEEGYSYAGVVLESEVRGEFWEVKHVLVDGEITTVRDYSNQLGYRLKVSLPDGETEVFSLPGNDPRYFTLNK